MIISSPMPTGNGAIVVHNSLQNHIPNYSVQPYSPKWEYFPWVLHKFSNKNAEIIHTTPDYGVFHTRERQNTVVTLHNYVLDSFMQQYSSTVQRIHYKTDLKFFTKQSLKHAHTVTSVSQFIADLTKQDLKYKGDIKVIPNGIDTDLFTPAIQKQKNSQGRIKVLFCGNMSYRKGVQWIAPIIEKSNQNIEILYTSGLRGTQKILPSHPRLKCIGSIKHAEMPKIYQQADILLFPSVREGFGLAAAEAMACGLPVVATNGSALPELVHHAKGGYLCEMGNVQDFAEKINNLAESHLLRREMGEYNCARINTHFTLRRMVEAYRQLFSSIA